MGGYGSTRWSTTVTRVSTEGLLRLDVRSLARAGALCPGAAATVTWGHGVGISIEVRPERPDWLQVEYVVREPSVPGRATREAIHMVTTTCHFGGSRVWFACPGCASRRAVLFCLWGWFRCGACHQLAYGSTRLSGISRRPNRSNSGQQS
jgi:hypothetical protein